MPADKQTLLIAYAKMLEIRITEEMIAADFIANKIFSFYHSSQGQEAVAVGASLALEPGDKAISNHRNHAHMLAKGGNLYELLCEIYGKADGCCKGYGGSMHSLARNVGFVGSTPILGSSVPLACGSAFAQKQAGDGKCTVAYFGDGASEEGVVYEAMNLAALWKLPVIFLMENNIYATATPPSDRRSERFSRSSVVNGLGCMYMSCDGNDFEDVYNTVRLQRSLMFKSGFPAFIEAKVYREMAHSGPLKDEKSRIGDSAEVRAASDPIVRIERRLTDMGAEILSIRESVQFRVRRAFDAMKTAPAAKDVIDVYA